MAMDMVGYDIIVQMKADTVADAASIPFENIPGQTAFLLGGPFLVAPNLPAVGAFQGGMFYGVVEIRLRPRMGDANLIRLAVSVRDGSLIGGNFPEAINGLGCSADLSVPLGLRYLAGLKPDGTWPANKEQQEAAGQVVPPEYETGLFIDLRAAKIENFQLEGPARASLVGLTSAAVVSALEDALAKAIRQLLKTAPAVSVPLGFGALRVRPGVTSTEFNQLADWPAMRWLSPSTLAVAGLYRGTAGQGDLSRKDGHSDIDRRPLKFVYPGPQGNMSAIPAPGAAVSISTDAMRRLGFCPAIRDHLARASVIEEKIPKVEDELKNRKRDYTPAEQQAYYDALVKAAKIKSIPEAMKLALHAAAKAGAAEWAASPEAAGALTAATPPDCGTGEARFLIKVPVWFDGHIVVTQVSFTPETGRIVTRLKAEARVTGVGANATATIGTRLSIDGTGQGILVTNDDPVVTTHGSGAAIIGTLVGFVTAPFGGAAWGIIIGTAAAALFDEAVLRLGPGLVLSEAGKFLGQLPSGISVPLPSRPLARLDEVVTGPSGLTIYALVGRTTNWNDTSSRVDLRATQIARSVDPEVPIKHGIYRKEVSCQDGLPREFAYDISGWRETWNVRAEVANVPGPLRFENVRIQLGDMWSEILQDGLLQPVWLAPTPLVAPETVVPGPAQIFETPSGARVVKEVRIAVTEVAPGQWEIRTRGADGYYGLRMSATCIDAQGTRHNLFTLFFPNGLVLNWDDAMGEEGRACVAKAKRELAQIPPVVKMKNMPPWAKVWDPVPWEERGRIQRALIARDRVALATFDQQAVQRELELQPSLLSGKIGPGRLR